MKRKSAKKAAAAQAKAKPQPQPAMLLKPKPKGQRPRCLHCSKVLEPLLIGAAALPPRLVDGRRKAEREEWERTNAPKFTGSYGRFADNRFCGMACGYHWAVDHTKAPKAAAL